MNLIKNELRRFLYAFWMPVALLAVLGFLIFCFIKPYAGQSPQDALLFLLGDRKYHGILYALLALFIFALDVDSCAINAQIMSGQSTAAIVLRKSVLYFAAVIVLNGIYIAVCLRFCNISAAGVWRSLLIRLVFDLGAAAIFIPLQLIFKTLQPTLILSGVAATVFIMANAPAYEQWYTVINGAGLPAGKMLVAVAAVVLCTAAAVVLLKQRRNAG